MPPDGQPIVDAALHRERFEERRRYLAQNPRERRITIRATVHVIHDLLKEARVGPYTFRSDEAVQHGGTGEAPSPLGYFVAAVGF